MPQYLIDNYNGFYSSEIIDIFSKYVKYWLTLNENNLSLLIPWMYFKDKDKNEYYVLFYQLTNGVDIKIADYKKNKDGKWELIYINPEKCLENKNNL